MHKAKRLATGRYEYRGILVVRRDHIRAGKYGAWAAPYAPVRGYTLKDGTLADMKRTIDNILDK